jgi:hypothetical protein
MLRSGVVTIAGLAGMKRRRYCVERAWQMSMQAPHSVLTPEVMSVCAGDAEADVVKVQNGEPSSGILDKTCTSSHVRVRQTPGTWENSQLTNARSDAAKL